MSGMMAQQAQQGMVMPGIGMGMPMQGMQGIPQVTNSRHLFKWQDCCACLCVCMYVCMCGVCVCVYLHNV
jgi:hypothetical protein